MGRCEAERRRMKAAETAVEGRYTFLSQNLALFSILFRIFAENFSFCLFKAVNLLTFNLQYLTNLHLK